MKYEEEYALKVTAKLLEARLSGMEQGTLNQKAGENLGDMYEALYKKVLAVVSSTE